eukprot:scaffold270850_cov50-Prasinocladus_malaysianus.AAC.1
MARRLCLSPRCSLTQTRLLVVYLAMLADYLYHHAGGCQAGLDGGIKAGVCSLQHWSRCLRPECPGEPDCARS